MPSGTIAKQAFTSKVTNVAIDNKEVREQINSLLAKLGMEEKANFVKQAAKEAGVGYVNQSRKVRVFANTLTKLTELIQPDKPDAAKLANAKRIIRQLAEGSEQALSLWEEAEASTWGIPQKASK